MNILLAAALLALPMVAQTSQTSTGKNSPNISGARNIILNPNAPINTATLVDFQADGIAILSIAKNAEEVTLDKQIVEAIRKAINGLNEYRTVTCKIQPNITCEAKK